VGLVKNDPADVSRSIHLARKVRRKINQNLFWQNLFWQNLFWQNLFWQNLFWQNLFWAAIYYNLITLPVAAWGALPFDRFIVTPGVGGSGDERFDGACDYQHADSQPRALRRSSSPRRQGGAEIVDDEDIVT
jgi:hypothetical protein